MKRQLVAVASAIVLLPLSSAVASTTKAGAEPAALRHNSTLLAMDGTSPDDIWAVGFKGPEGGGSRSSYVRHWDGRSWKTVDSPYVAGGHLESVTAIAADDVWAVGASGYETLNLAEHWDGTSWTLVSVPNHEGAYNRLTGVSFGSAHQVLAVGAWYAGGGGSGRHRSMALERQGVARGSSFLCRNFAHRCSVAHRRVGGRKHAAALDARQALGRRLVAYGAHAQDRGRCRADSPVGDIADGCVGDWTACRVGNFVPRALERLQVVDRRRRRQWRHDGGD